MTFAGCSPEQLRPLLEMCASHDGAFVKLLSTPLASVIEQAMRLRAAADEDADDLEDRIWFACVASGLDPEDRDYILYPPEGFHL